MDDIIDTLAAYSNVCELSSGVRDLLRAARREIIEQRERARRAEDRMAEALCGRADRDALVNLLRTCAAHIEDADLLARICEAVGGGNGI